MGDPIALNRLHRKDALVAQLEPLALWDVERSKRRSEILVSAHEDHSWQRSLLACTWSTKRLLAWIVHNLDHSAHKPP